MELGKSNLKFGAHLVRKLFEDLSLPLDNNFKEPKILIKESSNFKKNIGKTSCGVLSNL